MDLMEGIEIEQQYKIDKQKLKDYYERVKNQYSNLENIEIIARFVNIHSIGASISQIVTILLYYKNKLKEDKGLLELSFEWIRAQEIRLSYKKYLVRADYPDNDLHLAVDDCIFRFFLDYDIYLRNYLFNCTLKEHEISALYYFFFSSYEIKPEEFSIILEKYVDYSPTIFLDEKQISTRVTTLRSGLSSIIEEDYKAVLSSRNEASRAKKEKEIQKFEVTPIACEFSGSLLERIIKSLCITKRKISENEIEKAVSQFLTGYFKFGKFYEFEEFRDLMKNCFSITIYEGLTDKYKDKFSDMALMGEIDNQLIKFGETNTSDKLDGIAWKNDLQPFLTAWLVKFLDNLIME